MQYYFVFHSYITITSSSLMPFAKNLDPIIKSINSKKIVVELSIVIFLIVGNFIIGFALRNSILDVMFPGDDPLHIIIANSFRENGNFMINYLGNYVFWEKSYDEIIEKYPTISFNSGKSPIYFILLGSVFQLFDTPQEDLYLHGSIFNNFISSLFIVLFFFLIKKYFNLKIAFLSSIMILFLPYFEFYSVFIRPHMLMYAFSLCALFFLQKKKFHYIMFGIFVGIAHLTHPFGIILGFSYVVFLLFNKEFKGFLIFFFTWQLVLVPLFVKNYINFGDIGNGLYLPFSNVFSPLLSLIIDRHDITTILHPGSVIVERLTELNKTELFDVISFGIKKFSLNFTMDIILVFIVVFSTLYFFKITKLFSKEARNYILTILLSSILFGFTISIVGFYAQLILVFVIPVLFFYIINKLRKAYFIDSIPRYSLFIAIFAFINLIAYYFTSILLNYADPDPHQLMLSLFLLIPLAIFCLSNIVKYINFNKITKNKIPEIIILLVIISPIIIESSYGIDFNKYAPEYNHESSDVKSTDAWINDNYVNIKNIASTDPLHVSYRTNIKSVAVPTSYNPPDFEKYLNHFDVSHLVFYGLTINDIEINYSSLLEPSTTFPYIYEPVFSAVNSTIIAKETISKEEMMSSDISRPILYFFKAKYLENIDSKESIKIYAELHNSDLSQKNIVSFCNLSEFYSAFNEMLYRCKQVIEFDPYNQKALNNLLIAYLYYGQPEIFIENYLKKFDWTSISTRFYYHLENDESVSRSWPILISLLIDLEKYDEALGSYDPIIEHYKNNLDESKDPKSYALSQTILIDTLKVKVKLLTLLEDYHGAQNVNLEITSINRTDLAVWLEIAQYHEKYEQWKQALHAYEFSQKLDPNNELINKKIEQLKLMMENNQ